MKRRGALLLGLLSLVIVACSSMHFGDSYHALRHWEKECKFDYSCRITSSPDGVEDAMRFEWRGEDYDGSRSSKSAEYKTASYTRSKAFRQTREAWIHFRVYLPSETMSADSQSMILTQYHDIPDVNLGEDWRHPISALSYTNGSLSYSYQGDTNSVTQKVDGEWRYTHPIQTFSFGAAETDKWHSFVYHHKFDITGKGILEIWHNGKYYSRPDIVLGYNDQKGPYWKFGVYYYEGKSDYSTRAAYFSDVKVILGQSSYDEISA